MRYPDGYIELLDRAKDIIISGGENISIMEVESVLMSHPAVADVAVIAHVKAHIAKFKAPESVDFALEVPPTSTGKLRNRSCVTCIGPDPDARCRDEPPCPPAPDVLHSAEMPAACAQGLR